MLVLRGHIEEVNCLLLLKGNLYSSADDGTIRVWNVEKENTTTNSPKTRILDLTQTKLTSTPSYLTKLEDLTALIMSHNNLYQLPQSISQLTSLRTLSLDHNQFRQFPASVAGLTGLTHLYLDHNEITHIPRTILEHLVNLEKLHLGHNKLTELPPTLLLLSKLHTLSVEHNRLVTLPEIGVLSSIRVLKMDNNLLKQLPYNLTQLSNLRQISLQNNPLQLPSNALQDVQALFEYLKSIQREDRRSLGQTNNNLIRMSLSTTERLVLPQVNLLEIA